jgi:hypothetical protein
MICTELASEKTDDWENLARIFSSAPTIPFAQHWAKHVEPAFLPAGVRIGWRADRFCYFAELRDNFPTTRARVRNDPLWELGDVLELFAGVKGDPAYVEYHTAPNGRVLQLLWPDPTALATVAGVDDLRRFSVTDDAAVARARIVEGGWQVYGELPASSLPGAAAPLAGQTWQVSFGRYDYHADGSFTLSSTSPLSKPSYHRRHEWREIGFR